MKVKVFTNAGDAPKLETEINQWLQENDKKISIETIKQSYAYDNTDFMHTLISIWYKEKAKSKAAIR